MKVEILRGKEHIGGNIIKVMEGETSILLDCGAMLPEVGQPKQEDNFDLSKIGHVDALFLSHHHGDHAGLLDRLPVEVALFASTETINYMNTLDMYLDRPLRTAGRAVHALFDGEETAVGSLRVKAFSVEHSAEGAVGFLVDGGGKRLLYTGDFKNKPGFGANHVDLLITEGTMLTRDAQAYPDEDAVEFAMRRVMRETRGRIFVLQSSANLPRIRSVVNARNIVSTRPLMQDVYLKFALEQTGHEELAAPYAFVWNGFDKDGKCAYDRITSHYCDITAATSCKRITDFCNGIVFIRPTMLKMLTKLIEDGMDISEDAFIFSMWRGYEKDPQVAALVERFKSHGVEPQYIHTSGHADRQHLKEFIDDIHPARLACVHSEDSESICELAGDIPVESGTCIVL